MINVKETIEANQFRTARGRAELKGKEINTAGASRDRARRAAVLRAEAYMEVARNLRAMVEADPDGIDFDELDAVEFIMERFEDLSRKAWETAIEKN